MEVEIVEAKISLKSEEIEQKIWKIIQDVPGLNIGYGSVRLVVYISKGDKDEAWKSGMGIIKGILQSVAIVGSVFVAPVLAPIAAGAFTGIVTESMQGMANVVIFVIQHSVEEMRKEQIDPLSIDEKLVYNEVKEVTAIGPVYSILRAPFFLLRGNRGEGKASGVNAVSGGINTAINCGLTMTTGMNEEIKKLAERISKTIIQILSKKVLDDVAKEKMTLEEGVELIKNVEENCVTMDIISMEAIEEVSTMEEAKVQDVEKAAILEEISITSSPLPQPEIIEPVKNLSSLKSNLQKIAQILKRQNKRGINGESMNITVDDTDDHELPMGESPEENKGTKLQDVEKAVILEEISVTSSPLPQPEMIAPSKKLSTLKSNLQKIARALKRQNKREINGEPINITVDDADDHKLQNAEPPEEEDKEVNQEEFDSISWGEMN